MPQSPRPDYRRADERTVVAGLRQQDPLALAEAYHRTVPAAYACARRLLTSSASVEALLRSVYAELWASPPEGVGLEGWVRARCFELGAAELRARGSAPASPSAVMLLPDLPAPSGSYLDAAERGLAELDDPQREAILLAHDHGLGSAQQAGGDAAAALTSALVALAGQPPDPATDDGCADLPDLADWVLGLLAPDRAAQVETAVASRPECGALAQVLRAGRRRIEGLPITSDMGLRVLAVVLTDDAGAGLGRAPNETDLLLAHVAATASAPPGDTEPLPSALDQPADDELHAAAGRTPVTGATPAEATPATGVTPPSTTSGAATSAAAATSAGDAARGPSSAGANPSQVAPAATASADPTSADTTSAGAASAGSPSPGTASPGAASAQTAATGTDRSQPASAGAVVGGGPAEEAGSKPLPAPLRDELNGQDKPGVGQTGKAVGPVTSGEGQATGRTAGGSVAASNRDPSTPTDDEPASRGLRVAGIVLAVLFLIAGVALGLYIGFQVLM